MNSLYCFLGTEGLIFLKRGYLPFLSLSQLPEPWLQAQTVYQKQNEVQIAAADFRQHLQQQYQQLPDNLRTMISFDYFEQQSLSKREQIEQALVATTSSQFKQLFDHQALSDWRVLALYSQWQSHVLWQQLAAAGRGMVLELELSKSDFRAESYNQHGQHLAQVKAVQHWQPEDDLYYVFHRPSEGVESNEQEWRLLRRLSAADRQIEVRGASRAMYRMPSKAVSRIILGYGTSQEYCRQVKQYLSRDIHYRHCQCVQAQLDPHTMRLQLNEIT